MKMLENLTLEAILPVASGAIGFVFRQFAEARREVFEIAREKAAWARESHDAAAARTAGGGTWMRRAVFILIAFVFVAVIVAGFVRIPVVVETERMVGWLFWRHLETVFEVIDGVIFPESIRQAFLSIIGFYFGQGIR